MSSHSSDHESFGEDACADEIISCLEEAGDWVNHDTLMQQLGILGTEEVRFITVIDGLVNEKRVQKKKGKKGLLYSALSQVPEIRVHAARGHHRSGIRRK